MSLARCRWRPQAPQLMGRPCLSECVCVSQYSWWQPGSVGSHPKDSTPHPPQQGGWVAPLLRKTTQRNHHHHSTPHTHRNRYVWPPGYRTAQALFEQAQGSYDPNAVAAVLHQVGTALYCSISFAGRVVHTPHFLTAFPTLLHITPPTTNTVPLPHRLTLGHVGSVQSNGGGAVRRGEPQPVRARMCVSACRRCLGLDCMLHGWPLDPAGTTLHVPNPRSTQAIHPPTHPTHQTPALCTRWRQPGAPALTPPQRAAAWT